MQLSLDIRLAWTYLHDTDAAALIAALLFTNPQTLRQRLALGGRAGSIAAHHIIAGHHAIQALTGIAALLEREHHH